MKVFEEKMVRILDIVKEIDDCPSDKDESIPKKQEIQFEQSQ